MSNDAPFVIFESDLGSLARGTQSGGLDPSLARIPIVLNARLPGGLRERFHRDTVLNNDVQLKLASECRKIVGSQIVPFLDARSTDSAALRARVNEKFGDANPRLVAIIANAIKRADTNSSAWKDYRVDSTKEIARISLTLAFAATSAALVPPTGGAAIALLIVTLVRGLADASKKFGESYRTAEESRQRVIAEIDKLTATYQRSRHAGRAMQLAGAAAHALTIGKVAATVRSDPLPGFTRIKTEFNAYKGKLGHLNEYAERLGRRLDVLLTKIEEYRAAQNITLGEEGRYPHLLKLEREVNGLLSDGVSGKRHGFRGKVTISDAWQNCQNGLRLVEEVDRAFNSLKAMERHTDAVVLTDRMMTLLLNAGVALAGYQAVLSVAGGTTDQVRNAMNINQSSNGWRRGAAAIAFNSARQFMSLFKDSHSLARELGVGGGSSAQSQALTESIAGEFAAVNAAPAIRRASPDLRRQIRSRFGDTNDIELADMSGRSGAPPIPTRSPLRPPAIPARSQLRPGNG